MAVTTRRFDERDLREAIVETWGAFGAHADVYDAILKHVDWQAAEIERLRDLLAGQIARDGMYYDLAVDL